MNMNELRLTKNIPLKFLVILGLLEDKGIARKIHGKLSRGMSK